MQIRSTHVVGRFEAIELRKDLFEGFAANVGQHVEAAAVGHSHDDRFDAQLARLVDDCFHGRDQDLASFKTKTLLGSPLAGQKSLKAAQ